MPETPLPLYRAGTGEPLLLLHGFTGAWIHWRPLLPALSARYEVVAPTLAGHDGAEPYPLSSPLTFAGAAESLEEHLDQLGVGNAHIVGNSMGGGLALELAKRGRARSVVALAPAGGWTRGDGESQRLARFFARQLRLTRTFAPRLAMVFARPRTRRLALRDIMRRGDCIPASDAVDLAQASLRCTIADRALEALRADCGLALEDLERIDCPVLLASPQFDRVLPAERHAPRLRREIRGVESLTLAGCGHMPMWDNTPLIVRTISDFVDRHTQAQQATPRTRTRTQAPAPAPATQARP